MWYAEIGLFAHPIDTNTSCPLDLLVDTIVQRVQIKIKVIFTLTYYNFCLSTPMYLKFEILYKCITMLCGTASSMWNIPPFNLNMRNIL